MSHLEDIVISRNSGGREVFLDSHFMIVCMRESCGYVCLLHPCLNNSILCC